jgi:TIR domain-containing protein
VKPLAKALDRMGFRIWYDEFELKVGDSLRQSIDQGLVNSRFGIVILSPAFFAKNWPQYELNGLTAREMDGKKVILPVWHGVTREDVLGYSPTLADKVALSTSRVSMKKLAAGLADVLGTP